MLRHNLSTRPFYNERVIHAALALVTLVALGATAYNAWQYVQLSGRSTTLHERITSANRRTEELRSRAAKIRAAIDPRELEVTIAEAEEANSLIDRRVFSWTELFNHFEATLPESVRIASVRPRIERARGMTISIVLVARNVEGINTFIEKLETEGAFTGLLSKEEFIREDGALQATLEGQYAPGASRTPRVRAVRR